MNHVEFFLKKKNYKHKKKKKKLTKLWCGRLIVVRKKSDVNSESSWKLVKVC